MDRWLKRAPEIRDEKYAIDAEPKNTGNTIDRIK